MLSTLLRLMRGTQPDPTPAPTSIPPDDAPPDQQPQPAPRRLEKKKGHAHARVANRVPTEQQKKIINTAQQHPGLSLREIGALTDTDHAHVHRTLQTYGIDRELTENYKSHRADVLAGLQHRLLSSITDAEIVKSTPYQRIGSAALLYDKERIERGQPSAIIGHGVALSPPLQEAVDRIIGRLAPVDNSVINHPSPCG